MGKRIVSQARGHGSLTYRVRRKGYSIRLGYTDKINGKGKILKLVDSAGHSAPLIKIISQDKVFYNPAFTNAFEGQEIEILGKNLAPGNIMFLKDIPIGTEIYNIESMPGDGGKFIRSAGSFASVIKKETGRTGIIMPSKKELTLDDNCRATIGRIAGAGRMEKPLVKAGKKFYIMKAKGRKWHYTSKVKVNAVDHPFGGGRGKRIKSKIAKRNAPPGARVGHIRPSRTGRK